MKPRTHFDLARFGRDVTAGLDGRSYRAFVAEFEHVTIKTLSRACNAQPLSPANLMALCAALRLDPFNYFSVEDHTVTPDVSRGTLRRREGIGAILSGLREGQS